MRSRNEIFRNKWLKLSGDRLKWLSDKKNYMVRVILQLLSNERTLTFCNSINQTEELGKYCINSKNKESDKILQDFNEGKIKHITSCNMLNEGINLTNCRVGIYANLNSSDIIIKQRLGRILRHKHPVIIIPFYKNTREEELVQKMLEDYNPELIKIVNNPYEIII
jgi:superfamily II DNA or RNA helicase